MSWLITGAQPFPAVIGEPFGGGYFAGYISHTEDGSPTHALIVAPRETGATGTGYTLTTNLQWKTTNTATANTTSLFDGSANTAAMVTEGIANHPAAQFCVNLNIGGFADWYLPARYELEIAYFNLKPTSAANNTLWGINDYSVPKRTANYTLDNPSQTSIIAFNTNAEAFEATAHWSSNDGGTTQAWPVSFATGTQANTGSANNKIATRGVRAFRRIAL
jgi:hypothetical protein